MRELILRDYQEECVSRVLNAYEQNPHGQELLVLPTGAGKTIVFSAVIHSLARGRGLNALVICHRDELMTQAADKYRMIKPDAIIGKVGSGLHQYGGEVTVASIATISRPEHIKQLRAIGYGLIIVDETHHVMADSYQRVLDALPESFVLGVTATPDRLDKKALFGGKPPLYQATIIDMVTQGYLCNFKAIAIQTQTNLDDIHTQMGDFNEKELDLAVNTPERNMLIARKYEEHVSGKRAVAFCVTVAHAQALCYAFNEQGISAAVIEGGTPLEERAHIYKSFRAGDIRVLCNVMVLTEGWDEPLCEVAIMARPTQSRGLFTQQFGRVLRPAPGKKHAIILDITDNSYRLRLTPQNIRSVIGRNLLNDETLLASLAGEEAEKEEREASEKRALIRKLNERRDTDKIINLFALPEWQEKENGMFVLEVGIERHRIALVPWGGLESGMYEVWARLAPNFNAAQKWSGGQPLDWAMQIAEKRARALLEDPKNKVLIDKSAPWRAQPMSEGQKGMLRMYRIPHGPGTSILTKGDAADAIDQHKQEIERRKAAKAARDAEREKQKEDDDPPGNLYSNQGFSLMR